MRDETGVITPDMLAIIRGAMLCFVATVNDDGTPNLSPKASLTTRGDRLLFADIASPRTVANLRRNPSIAVNVVDIFARRGYRFEGTAMVLPPGDPDYDSVAEWVWSVNGKTYPVDHVVSITVKRATPLSSPAYRFGEGTTEESLRQSFLARYHVRPI
jgi:uncharacterized protein